MTLSDTLSCLFAFYLTHHVPKNPFQALLDLLHPLPPKNLLPKTVDQFLRLFCSADDRLVFHDYCETCFYEFKADDTTCTKCPGNPWRYQGGKEDQAKRAFFFELPMRRDIEELFQGNQPLIILCFCVNCASRVMNLFADAPTFLVLLLFLLLLQQTRLLSQGCPPAMQRSLSLGFFETSKTGLSTGVWSTLASSAVTTGTWPWTLTLTVFPLTSHQRFPCGPSFGRSTIFPLP